MARFKEKELRKLSEYKFSLKGSLDKIKKTIDILEGLPLEKITLSAIGYVADKVEDENLSVLHVSYDNNIYDIISIRPKYHVLDAVVVDDPNLYTREIGKTGARIEPPKSKTIIEIYYNSSLKDKL